MIIFLTIFSLSNNWNPLPTPFPLLPQIMSKILNYVITGLHELEEDLTIGVEEYSTAKIPLWKEEMVRMNPFILKIKLTIILQSSLKYRGLVNDLTRMRSEYSSYRRTLTFSSTTTRMQQKLEHLTTRTTKNL